MHLCGDRLWLYFTNRACADAYWATKRSRNSGTGFRSSPDQPVPLPRNVKQCTSDDDPPVRKAPRPSPRSCQTSGHWPTPQQSSQRKSMVPRRCQRCLWHYRYRVSPRSLSRRISGSCLRLRLRSIHHRPGPLSSNPLFGFSRLWLRVFGVSYNGLPGVCSRCGLGCGGLTGSRWNYWIGNCYDPESVFAT